MHILLIGSGGREHALAWKITQSPLCEKLFVSPGNAGTQQIAQNIAINWEDKKAIKKFILENKIEMIVVGPEQMLCDGLRGDFEADEDLKNIHFIGPNKAGAKLEGSKDFAKAFMQQNKIPTAAYQTFEANEIEKALQFIQNKAMPIVLKADGLAAGKGVLICETLAEAEKGLKDLLLNQQFGEASKKVVVEEFLKGIELSVFVITDGKNYKLLPTAKDYKRIGEGDTGLNTGGMGAISPVPFLDKSLMQKIETQIIQPTLSGLQKANINYQGFIFLGLMNVQGNPYVIEYNVRLGDPETEAILPRIESDLVELFLATSQGKLQEYDLKIKPEFATTLMLVSGGYPEKYEKGKAINGLKEPLNGILFHAGTKQKDNKTLTNGGRVIAITVLDKDMKSALNKTYQDAEKIDFEGKYFRRDIGFDL